MLIHDFWCSFKNSQCTANYFGGGARPSSIILTHGHFDHVGAVIELANEWNIPVYAHQLEMPYLKGISDYPPPDPGISRRFGKVIIFIFTETYKCR